jgi:hypothetical protein
MWASAAGISLESAEIPVLTGDPRPLTLPGDPRSGDRLRLTPVGRKNRHG